MQGQKLTEEMIIKTIKHWRANPVDFVVDAIGIKEEKIDPQQLEVLKALPTNKFIAIKSGHGVGKLEPVSTILDTPNGKRRWGDLKAGDKVFAEDGRSTKINRTFHQGEKDIYKVTFDDDSIALVGLEHLWKVKGRQQRRLNRDWIVLSTEDILKKGVLRANGITQARQWEIPTQGKAQFIKKDIELKSYMLGIWLGDGHSDGYSYTKPYTEVQEKIEALGYICKRAKDGKEVNVQGLRNQLQNLNILGLRSYERFIPDLYKYNSPDIRQGILEGLLDTDGECNDHGTIIYSSTSKQLVDDIIWLTRSLGGKAKLNESSRKGFYYDKNGNKIICRESYRVTITLNWNPFSIKHKKGRWHKPEDRYLKRWISNIEYSHKEEAMCIQVEHESQCYLTKDFIVTHNTAMESWIILWFLMCYGQSRVPATAPTEDQLTKILWPEINKWLDKSNLKEYLTWQKTKVYVNGEEESAFAVPRTASKPEALQGFHADNIMFILEEASGIEDPIWEPVEGALTSGNARAIALGNPTRPEGNFYRAFTDQSGFWKTFTFSSKNSTLVSKEYVERMRTKYGEDSDVYRVRVLGEFPSQTSNAFIPLFLCENSLSAIVEDQPRLRMGVDVARYGDDYSVWLIRGGGKIIHAERKQTMSTMEIAGRTIALMREYNIAAEATSIDVIGVGAGVVDRLVEQGFGVNAINNASKPFDDKMYLNRRVELWGMVKEALVKKELNLTVYNNDDMTKDLCGELASPHYKFASSGVYQLESKDDMKKRNVGSPDIADALTLTYAIGEVPVAPRGGGRINYPKDY